MSSTFSANNIHDPHSAAYKKARKKFLKTSKNRAESSDTDWTPFRTAEKKFKARFPPPDLSNVLDLAAGDPSRADEVQRGGWMGRADAVECREIRCMDGKKAYMFDHVPGLVLLPGFISPKDQKTLVRWSLREHAKQPNETNLDAHYLIPEEGLWNLYSRQSEEKIQPRAATLNPDAIPEGQSGPRQLISNEPASKENYTELLTAAKPPPVPSLTVKPTSPSDLIPKLRWANIGWYYHWGTKQYDFTRGKIDVNEGLKEVCREAVSFVPWRELFENDKSDWGDEINDWRIWNETYEPDAGIVNFYQTKDTLMAHVDRSEVCATSPLVSISLGCAAVFLIGGHTRDVEPTPILLRSGDVVIMSGPQCRRVYHGVPRILENTLPSHLEEPGEDWDLFAQYLQTTRVNINVRQVFPKGFDPVIDSFPS
ncbi:hypothetical protein C8Q75DRAFT_791959 [Abortiporus biennis]|nr:hypothetical protein C8Q75DRAFT_791959 [Abortiporus biennis]